MLFHCSELGALLGMKARFNVSAADAFEAMVRRNAGWGERAPDAGEQLAAEAVPSEPAVSTPGELRRERKRCHDRIDEQPCAPEVAKRAKETADAALNRLYGVATEQAALDRMPDVAESNSRMWYCRRRCAGGSHFAVGGRVDGIRGDRVVEVKNRARRLFRRVPDYEYVQVQAYMQALTASGRPCSLTELTQRCGDDASTAEVERDDAFWEEEVMPRLETICAAAAKAMASGTVEPPELAPLATPDIPFKNAAAEEPAGGRPDEGT